MHGAFGKIRMLEDVAQEGDVGGDAFQAEFAERALSRDTASAKSCDGECAITFASRESNALEVR